MDYVATLGTNTFNIRCVQARRLRQRLRPILRTQFALSMQTVGRINSVESSAGLVDVMKAKKITKGKNQKNTPDFANLAHSVKSRRIL